jgi:site-specific DNA-adenine methylase
MYIDSVMNYTGSKFKLLSQILPHFDYTKANFVDLFTGGGSVYSNIVDKYEKVLVNDIIKDLVGIHENLVFGDEIITETKSICPGKNNAPGFAELRNSYNQDPTPGKLWALMLSSTNNMMRFNQKFKYNQTYGERGWNSNTDVKVENFTKHIRQYRDKLKFISNPFYGVNFDSNNIMYYIDPPYGRIKNEDGSIGKKQISEAGYNAFWKEDDDKKLYEYIKNIDKCGSSFMVSGVLEHGGKICWMLDKLIQDGFKSKELNFDYNKVSRKGDKKTIEVIIMNY